MFRTRDRIEFDNGETYFTGTLMFFYEDDTLNVKLDPEFADYGGQRLNRVNPDYCEIIGKEGDV